MTGYFEYILVRNIGGNHLKKRLLTVLVTGTVLSLGALAPSVNAQDFDSQIETLKLIQLKLKKLKFKKQLKH